MIDCSNPAEHSAEHQAIHIISLECRKIMSIMMHMQLAAKQIGLTRELDNASALIVSMHMQSLAKHRQFEVTG